jgi:hypothetical protein
MNKVSPYFCVAPWTHTYVSPQGERRLCCASREEASFQKQYIDSGTDNASAFNPISLKEHWNSEYMKDIRKRILAGEKISQCDICNDQILNIHTYKKYFTETLFPQKIDEILNSTDATGYTTMQPVSYDYRISNLCNFKCRMCGEQLSSSWETEKIKYNRIDFKKDKWLVPETRQQISAFQKNVLEEELQRAVDNNTIEEIYWVGGEPLMMERHWTIMDQLVKSGQSKNVIVRYNTNLSKITYKEYELYNMLPHFKRVNVCASIDGVGDVGEYIRTGLDWNQWLDNFKKGMFLIKQFGDDALVFDVTLTTPGLFNLKQLFDVVTELNVKSYLKITFAFDPSIPMSPLILPRDILERTVADLLEYIEPRLTVKNRIYKEVLLDLLKRQTFEEQWPNTFYDGRKRAKSTVNFLESKRTQSITFKETLPDYAREWWESI